MDGLLNPVSLASVEGATFMQAFLPCFSLFFRFYLSLWVDIKNS